MDENKQLSLQELEDTLSSKDRVGIVQAFDEYIDDDDRYYDYLRASQVSRCPRETFYKIKKVKETVPLSAVKKRRMAAGKFAHLFLEQVIKTKAAKKGLEHFSEKDLVVKSDKFNGKFGGQLDHMLESKTHGLGITDVKTIQQWGFNRLLEDLLSGEGTGYYPEHKGQALDYKVLWESIYPDRPIKWLTIFYLELPHFRRMEVPIQFTKEDEEKAVEKIRTFNQHLKDNTLPPCTCAEQKDYILEGCVYGDVESRVTKRKRNYFNQGYDEEVNTKCCSDKLIKGENAVH